MIETGPVIRKLRFRKAKYPEHMDPAEREIIDAAIRDALKAGLYISVSGEGVTDLTPTWHYDLITSHVASCGQTELDFFKSATGDGRNMTVRVGWVLFVHGNGYDVIADYTANDETEALVARANALAQKLEERAHA